VREKRGKLRKVGVGLLGPRGRGERFRAGGREGENSFCYKVRSKGGVCALRRGGGLGFEGGGSFRGAGLKCRSSGGWA